MTDADKAKHGRNQKTCFSPHDGIVLRLNESYIIWFEHHEICAFGANMRERTGDGETTEAVLVAEGLGLADGGLGRDDNGVKDKAVLVALDLADHLGLVFHGAVVVDDTETTKQSHVNGHVVLGDSVHGRRKEGRLQGNALGNGRVKGDFGSGEALESNGQAREQLMLRGRKAYRCSRAGPGSHCR